jgi:hypothetical protein
VVLRHEYQQRQYFVPQEHRILCACCPSHVPALVNVQANQFETTRKVETVEIFPNYASAYAAWKAKEQQSSTMRTCTISLSIFIGCLMQAKMPSRSFRLPSDGSAQGRRSPN